MILLHGLGGDHNDWMNPFQERDWPYDHKSAPSEVDLGLHAKPPIGKLPGIETCYYLLPQLTSNARGRDGSDDRSWWHMLVKEGYPVLTYSQVPEPMVLLSRGPVAELKTFMDTL